MDRIYLVLMALVFVSASILWWKRKESFISVLASIFAATVLLLSQNGFEEKTTPLLGIGLTILFVSLFFSRFLSAQWILVVPILLSALYFIVLNQNFTFDDNSLLFTKSNALFVPIVGAIIPALAFWKARFVQRFLTVNVLELENVIVLILVALSLLFAQIFASNYGYFLLSIGFLSSSLMMNRLYGRSLIPSIGLIGLAYSVHFLSDVSIEIGKVTDITGIVGFVLGTASITLLNVLISKKTNPSFLSRLFVFLLPMAFIAFVLFMETQKEHTAGYAAWFGIGIAFLLAAYRIKAVNHSVYIAFWSFLILAGILAYPSLKINEELSQSNAKLEVLKGSSEIKTDPFSLPGLAISNYSGEYIFDEKNSKITFQLGKEGAKTKGIFTAFSGTASISTDDSKSKFSVLMPVKNLSTFNDMRDESLRTALYFDEAKFPLITFVSKELKADGDSYILEGDFSLKGITKQLEIRLKVLKTGEEKGKKYILFIGKSSLDRSKFGMESDPKIGDIVDFEFEVEAIEK